MHTHNTYTHAHLHTQQNDHIHTQHIHTCTHTTYTHAHTHTHTHNIYTHGHTTYTHIYAHDIHTPPHMQHTHNTYTHAHTTYTHIYAHDIHVHTPPPNMKTATLWFEFGKTSCWLHTRQGTYRIPRRSEWNNVAVVTSGVKWRLGQECFSLHKTVHTICTVGTPSLYTYGFDGHQVGPAASSVS